MLQKVWNFTGRQYPLVAEAILKLGTDSVINTSGVETPLKAQAVVTDLFPLPPGAVILGGDVTVDTPSTDSDAATITVGDSANPARYLAATSTKAAARTALVPTGYRGNGEAIRVTLSNGSGDATAGQVSIRVMYVIFNRTNEVQTL